jgi:hypothetical protein
MRSAVVEEIVIVAQVDPRRADASTMAEVQTDFDPRRKPENESSG